MNFRHSIATVKNTTLANRLGTATLRRVTIGTVAMGFALFGSTQFGTTPAHAATNFTVGTVAAAGFCNYDKHTMTMSGTIHLSNRFPNGATVYSRYAYYPVDSGGKATANPYTTGWSLSIAGPPWTTGNDVVYGPFTMSSNPSPLASVTVPGWGHWHVMVQVAVWNGSSQSYEYSGWDQATYYTNAGPWGQDLYPGGDCTISQTQ